MPTTKEILAVQLRHFEWRQLINIFAQICNLFTRLPSIPVGNTDRADLYVAADKTTEHKFLLSQIMDTE
jgi:hypothetical protein